MGRDNSMDGRTPEWVDNRAKEDAAEDNYDPPYTWIPFTRDSKGTEARDRYDRAFDHHSGKKDK